MVRGGGDLNSLSPLKTRKLYTTQSSQNARSARSTPPSHTTSHTAWSSALQYIAAAPESRSAHQPAGGSQITRPEEPSDARRRPRPFLGLATLRQSGWNPCLQAAVTGVTRSNRRRAPYFPHEDLTGQSLPIFRAG